VIHSTRALHARIAHTDRASYHTQEALSQRIGPQPGGMQTVIFIAGSTKNTYTLPG